MKFVAIDIGNSSINIGFFMGQRLFVQKIDTSPMLKPTEYSALFTRIMKQKKIDKKPEGVIISSVVPRCTGAVAKACKILIGKEPLILTHKLKTGLKFRIREPEKLGADRIAASAAACELFGAPVAVVDFGTATTLDFIGRGNVYKGGAIMPGLTLMKNALSDKTAQLPDVDISRPKAPLGKDTRENILSGIIYGTAGAVDRIIAETEKAERERFKVVATGGFCGFVAPFLQRCDYIEPALVLKGLKAVYERNL